MLNSIMLIELIENRSVPAISNTAPERLNSKDTSILKIYVMQFVMQNAVIYIYFPLSLPLLRIRIPYMQIWIQYFKPMQIRITI
jgi:hypothetical protein